MNTIIENSLVRAEISPLGAELVSFKNKATGCEYIWNGDTALWSGHAPILFPIVCALENGQTVIEGQTCSIGNHGFVRKTGFTLGSQGPTEASFILESNPETLKMYPYDFRFTAIYSLDGSNLRITFKVDNTGNRPMQFQIGTHPGFTCPLEDGLVFSDYVLRFSEPETFDGFSMNSANVLIPGVSTRILDNGTVLPLDYSLFDKGAVVIKKVNSRSITLESSKSKRRVVMTFDKFPTLGLWNTKKAPFICIEPWHGLADEEGSGGTFATKAHLITLGAGQTYDCFHAMDIGSL